jgi:hypothetical protein
VTLALLVLATVALILALPSMGRALAPRLEARRKARSRRSFERAEMRDPGRERRAEQRARELLRSCVNEEEWAMYRDLGFIRVHGRLSVATDDAGEPRGLRLGTRRRESESAYAYLIYPHKPVVAYMPQSGRLLSEYCVEFPDLSGAIGGSRLPASDDVLAKWMALTGDEERLLRSANMHLVGRQVDPGRVRRDLWRLTQWERERGVSHGDSGRRQLS